MPTIRIPSPLRTLSGGRREVAVAAGSLRAVLEALECECPGFAARILAGDGSILPYINIYLDGNDVRLVGSLDAHVGPKSVLDIVPAVSGGSALPRAAVRSGSLALVAFSALVAQACASPTAPPTQRVVASAPATIAAPSTPTLSGAAPTAPAQAVSASPPATAWLQATSTRPSPTAAASTPRSDLPAPVRAALAEAQRRAPSGEQARLVSAEPVEWPDSSLGCPQPGMLYAQVMTPGFRVKIDVAGLQLEYHTDSGTRADLCNRN